MSRLHFVKLYYEINNEWSHGYYFGLCDRDIIHHLKAFQGSNLNVRSMNRLFVATDKWLRTTCRLCRIPDWRVSRLECFKFGVIEISLDPAMLLDDDDIDEDEDDADQLAHEDWDWDDEWNQWMLDEFEQVQIEHERQRKETMCECCYRSRDKWTW